MRVGLPLLRSGIHVSTRFVIAAPKSLTAQALAGLPHAAASTVGLVGAEMASHPAIASPANASPPPAAVRRRRR